MSTNMRSKSISPLLLLTAMALACGPDEIAQPLDQTPEAKQFAEAVCGARETCGCEDSRYAYTDACEAEIAATFDTALADGGVLDESCFEMLLATELLQGCLQVIADFLGDENPAVIAGAEDFLQVAHHPGFLGLPMEFQAPLLAGDLDHHLGGRQVANQQHGSALVTLVERKSGYARIARIDDMTTATTMRAAKRRLKDLPASLRRSVTFDNGKEFAGHATLTEHLGLDVYFAKPYASWQRGTNENTNGLLRQFFPKGTDFTQISHRAVARVEELINERPRRRLGYRTPNEVLSKRMRCN